MKIEPNLLLAISTGTALLLLIATGVVFGEPGNAVKYVVLAIVIPAVFVPLNGWYRKRMGWVRPALVHADTPSTAVWASLFPLVLMLAAGAPVLWPDHDYGLLVLIAAIWFGVTVESALKARQPS